MHIFFDQAIFQDQAYGGISRYICELAYHLAKDEGLNVTIFGGWTKNQLLQNIPHHPNLKLVFLKRKNNWRINKFAKNLSYVWQRLYFHYCIKNKKETIYHPTFFNFDLSIQKSCASMVMTFHDMIAEKENKKSKYCIKHLHQKKNAAQSSDGIIAVSQNTYNDLVHYYPDSSQKAKVIYEANSLAYSHSEEINLSLPNKFFLIVGNRSGYKNGIASIKAFDKLSKLYPNIHLIFCGGPPLSNEELKLTAKNSSNILHLQTSDKELAYIYSKAIGLLYPSTYEGFGIPIIEAMSLSCPVITSKISSLPEVGGEAALYCNPYSPNDIYSAMKLLLSDNDFFQKAKEKSYEQSKKFSWSKTAKETHFFYKQIFSLKA